jgi:glycosyltransferase involved in cell wall biosynthesis
MGHEVTVATTALAERSSDECNGVRLKEFACHGLLNHSVLGIRGETERYQHFLQDEAFDVILNYAAQTWCTDLTLPLLGQLSAKTVLVPCGYSGLIGARRLLYRGYFRNLPRYLRQYSALVYHSSAYIDKYFGDAHHVENFEIIPNGVDADEFRCPRVDFRRQYQIDTRFLLLTVGNHFSNKGHSRVLAAFERLRTKDVTLVVVGHDSAPWYRSCSSRCSAAAKRSSGRIRFIDQAKREEVVAAYFAADLFLSGSHIEAFPLVIVEAMASGTPFIAFPAGCITALPGGTVVRSVTEMAHMIDSLLEAPAMRSDLAAVGKAAQAAQYDWSLIASRYESLYKRLVATAYA